MTAVNETLPQPLVDRFVGLSHGDYDGAKAMLDQRPGLVNGVARWGETPIEAAAQMAHRGLIEMLLAHGAPLSICTAAVLGMNERVKEMLKSDPSLKQARGAHGIPLMYYPIVTGNRELAEYLLAQGVPLNIEGGGNTPLHGAVMFNQPEMAEWLLQHGVDANAPDFEGKTALARAIESGNDRLAEILRAHGGVE